MLGDTLFPEMQRANAMRENLTTFIEKGEPPIHPETLRHYVANPTALLEDINYIGSETRNILVDLEPSVPSAGAALERYDKIYEIGRSLVEKHHYDSDSDVVDVATSHYSPDFRSNLPPGSSKRPRAGKRRHGNY